MNLPTELLVVLSSKYLNFDPTFRRLSSWSFWWCRWAFLLEHFCHSFQDPEWRECCFLPAWWLWAPPSFTPSKRRPSWRLVPQFTEFTFNNIGLELVTHTHTLTHFCHFTDRFMVHWYSYQQFNDVNKECYYFHNLSDTLTCNLVSFPLCDTFKCLYFIQVFILVQHSLLFVPVRLNGGILSAVNFSPFLNALNPKWWVGFPLGISEPDKGNSRLHHRLFSQQLWWEVSCWTLICGSCSVEIRAVRFLQEDLLGILAGNHSHSHLGVFGSLVCSNQETHPE